MVPNGFQHIIGLGNFPCDWLISSADEITEKITKGTTPPKSEIVEGSNIPFLRVNNLGFDGVLNSKSEMLFVTKQAHNGFLLRSVAYPNDILMNIVGPPLGKIAMLDNQYPEYNMNQAVLIYRCKEKLIDHGYFLSYLGSELAQQWLQSRSKKTSGQQNLTIQLCKELPTPVPPLPEQRKIAQILSTWDKAIGTTEKLIETSKQQKKALMQELLTGKKRLVDPETGKAFEGEWEEVKVSTLITKHSEKTDTNKQYPVLTSSRKGIYFQSDYYNDRDVASEDTTGYNVVPRGYFTYRHMSDDLVFKFNRNTICDKGIVSTLYPVFAAKEEAVVPYLLQAILNEGSAFKRFSLSQKQGGSRTYMYLSKLNELKIQIPSLTEQQKITSALTAADKEIEVLKAKLAHFKQEKKALMQQLLTGKRRVKVAETEAA